MKVIVNTKELQAAVKKLGITAQKKASLPMCRDIHARTENGNTVVLGVTDANLVRYIPIRAEVIQPGRCAIDCDKLGKILSSAKKDTVTLELLENGDIRVESGVKVAIPATEWQDLEEIRAINPEHHISARVDFPEGVLQSAIKQVEWSRARLAEERDNLKSVCVDLSGDRAVIVATNGKTLAWQETAAVPQPPDNPEIVPEKYLVLPEHVLEAVKSMEGALTLTVWGEVAVLKTGAEDFIRLKLASVNYPNWRRVVPQDLKYQLALEDNLKKGLKDFRALMKTMETKDGKADITFTDEATKFSVITNDVSIEDEVPLQAEFSGIESGFQILLDLDLLIPLLGSRKDMPLLGVNSPLEPVKFDYTEGYHCLLMPARHADK